MVFGGDLSCTECQAATSLSLSHRLSSSANPVSLLLHLPCLFPSMSAVKPSSFLHCPVACLSSHSFLVFLPKLSFCALCQIISFFYLFSPISFSHSYFWHVIVLIPFTFPSSPVRPPFFHPPLHLTCHCNNLLSLSSLLSFAVSHSSPLILSFLSVLPDSSALRSCSTGDSLLSSAFIRSAKSAPALAPPLPVLLHHHHPLLPPLADQLAGTHSLHYLSACLPLCLETFLVCTSVKDWNLMPVVLSQFFCPSICHYWSNSLHVLRQESYSLSLFDL